MAQLICIKKLPPIPVDDIDYIDLRLTGDEANTLYDILCRVGGSPDLSRRQHAARIFSALRDVYPGRSSQRDDDMDGSIFFKEKEGSL